MGYFKNYDRQMSIEEIDTAIGMSCQQEIEMFQKRMMKKMAIYKSVLTSVKKILEATNLTNLSLRRDDDFDEFFRDISEENTDPTREYTIFSGIDFMTAQIYVIQARANFVKKNNAHRMEFQAQIFRKVNELVWESYNFSHKKWEVQEYRKPSSVAALDKKLFDIYQNKNKVKDVIIKNKELCYIYEQNPDFLDIIKVPNRDVLGLVYKRNNFFGMLLLQGEDGNVKMYQYLNEKDLIDGDIHFDNEYHDYLYLVNTMTMEEALQFFKNIHKEKVVNFPNFKPDKDELKYVFPISNNMFVGIGYDKLHKYVVNTLRDPELTLDKDMPAYLKSFDKN